MCALGNAHCPCLLKNGHDDVWMHGFSFCDGVDYFAVAANYLRIMY